MIIQTHCNYSITYFYIIFILLIVRNQCSDKLLYHCIIVDLYWSYIGEGLYQIFVSTKFILLSFAFERNQYIWERQQLLYAYCVCK